MRTCHLFAGAGGGLLCDLILGHTPVVAVEWDAYCCETLRRKVNEGWFLGMHVHECDIRLFDPSEYEGMVDQICAGFPCTDISVAGKQAGIGQETSSGLYREVIRCVRILRPQYVFMENVPAILSLRQRFLLIVIEKIKQHDLFDAQDNESRTGRYVRRIIDATGQSALGYVLGDMVSCGYDCRWLCLRASDVGANHHRDRWVMLAKRRDVGNPDVPNGETCSAVGLGKTEQTKRSACSSIIEENVCHPEHPRQPTPEISESLAPGSDHNATGAQQAIEPARPSEQCADVAYAQSAHSSRLPIGTPPQHAEHGSDGENVSDSSITGLSDRRQSRRKEGAAQSGSGLEPEPKRCGQDVSDTDIAQCQGNGRALANDTQYRAAWRSNGREIEPGLGSMDDALADILVPGWYDVEPEVGRVTNESKNRADKLKALGNGQHPLQMAVGYRILEALF